MSELNPYRSPLPLLSIWGATCCIATTISVERAGQRPVLSPVSVSVSVSTLTYSHALRAKSNYL